MFSYHPERWQWWLAIALLVVFFPVGLLALFISGLYWITEQVLE